MRQVKSVINADTGRKAVIFRDGNWNEYRVQFFTKGQHHKGADYHADDRQDAEDTAWNWCFQDERSSAD